LRDHFTDVTLPPSLVTSGFAAKSLGIARTLAGMSPDLVSDGRCQSQTTAQLALECPGSDALYDGPGGLAGLGGAWGERRAYSAVATRSAGASIITVGAARTSEALEPTTMSLLLWHALIDVCPAGPVS
jgi:hypothetical protein